MWIVGSGRAGEHERAGIKEADTGCQLEAIICENGSADIELVTAAGVFVEDESCGAGGAGWIGSDDDAVAIGSCQTGGEPHGDGGVEGAGVLAVPVVVQVDGAVHGGMDCGGGKEEHQKSCVTE